MWINDWGIVAVERRGCPCFLDVVWIRFRRIRMPSADLFNAVQIDTSWKKLEHDDGDYQWEQLDRADHVGCWNGNCSCWAGRCWICRRQSSGVVRGLDRRYGQSAELHGRFCGNCRRSLRRPGSSLGSREWCAIAAVWQGLTKSSE